jgi:hypothetical protein
MATTDLLYGIMGAGYITHGWIHLYMQRCGEPTLSRLHVLDATVTVVIGSAAVAMGSLVLLKL